MELSSSTSTKIHSIILTPFVLFFAILYYHMSNHAYGNVFMNKIIKRLSISMIAKYVLCLLNFVQQVVLNLREMFKQVVSVTDNITVSLFSVMMLMKLPFLEPVIMCSITSTMSPKQEGETSTSLC
jgi:hypothetical protein